MIALMALMALPSIAWAETVESGTFAQLDVRPLNVIGAQKESCTDPFIYAPTNSSDGLFEIVSLHVQFSPITSGDAVVSLFVDDASAPFQSWKAGEFQDGWVRAQISNENIASEKTIWVCVRNSNAITNSKLLADSSVGLYKTAHFQPGVDFTKTTSVQNATVGKEFTVTITAHNSGSSAANARITLLDESDVVKQLRGTTSWDGIIEAGKSVQFDYTVKPYYARPQYIAPGEPIPITLPSALLTYPNEFGETISLNSTRPSLSVREPEFSVMPTLIPEKQTLQVGESTTVLLALQNQGKEDLENVSVFVQVPKGLSVEEPGLGSISIPAGTTKTLSFQAKATQDGKQSLKCLAIYVDYDAKYSACDPSVIDVKSPSNNNVFTAAAVLLVIGALIYMVVYFR